VSPGPQAFDLVLASLDSDREKAGESYERIREKLLRFFEWRGADCPEDLVDRTFDRVGKKLQGGERIRESDPAAYFYGVARNILREHWTERRRESAALHRFAAQPRPVDDSDGERRFGCLESCLEALSPADRDLLVGYYVGRGIRKIGNRQKLCADLGVAPNALRIRMFRLRARLEECVERCLEPAAGRNGSTPVHTRERKDGDE
jgi:RNA polymerase sigma factor (sigma-70 family)